MEINYEPKGADIIDRCLKVLSTPTRVFKDTNSASYLKRRNMIDEQNERKLSASKIDDEAYYNELMKD
mgnify:CR=1 FL=1